MIWRQIEQALRRPPRGGVDRNSGCAVVTDVAVWSPPARGRGSKHDRDGSWHSARRSPPARGRGSKLHEGKIDKDGNESPPRGGVDRNLQMVPCGFRRKRHVVTR